jgi:hypothetical protein
MVVEHIHGLAMAQGPRRHHAKTALEILHLLIKKTTVALVNGVWIDKLLESGGSGNMDDSTFIELLKLSARRNGEGTTADMGAIPGGDYICVQSVMNAGRIESREATNLEHPLFVKISQNIQTRSEEEGGWQDDAVYGGLIAMRGIPRLGSYLPDSNFLETLSKAMKSEENKPLRVRKAAYDVIPAARNGWLRSPELRQKLEELDFPRQLHSVVIDIGLPGYQRSFLMMMEILSEDGYWHSYLRESMDLWLPLRHKGPDSVFCILTRISDMPFPEYNGPNPPLDELLTKLVEDGWAGVPGRPVTDLTADRLEPLVEVTMQFGELLFTESGRRVVLAAVDQVIPSLERRRDGGYAGPGEDIYDIVDELRRVLQSPMPSASR